MYTKEFVAFAASISTASAAIYQGFNYGSNTPFASSFALAKSLAGTNGAFTSARLYTSIEQGTTNTPSSAFEAAIDQDVTLLLGLWASAGDAAIQNEIAAIKAAAATHGTAFTSRVVGISVGSEDLYRNSPTGIAGKDGIGANPDDIVSYIQQVRSAVAGTGLAGIPIGHVDTWTAWVNGSNDAVISACDFLGMDAYPYFQNTQDNNINSGYDLFFSAYDQTVNAGQGKPVWVTETGWPDSGPTSGQAVPSTANAKQYWDQVACKLLGQTNTWWYTLNDFGAAPSFGVTDGSQYPNYDLTCSSSTSSSSAAMSTATSSKGSATSSAASLTSHESTATASNVIVSVSSTAVASQVGGGSPADHSSIAADSSAASFASASPSAYSSAVAAASSAASAAKTDSTATVPASTAKASSSALGATIPINSATAAATSAASSAASSASSFVSSSMPSSAVGSVSQTGSAPATSSTHVTPYTGGASTVQSTGGIIAAIVALVAFL